MENEQFEYEQNINQDEETVEQIISEYTQPQENACSGAGVGRKESPFANSPYETGYQPSWEAPAPKPEKKKAKTRRPGRGKRALAAVLALVLLAGSCGMTALLVNNHWETKTQIMEDSLTKKLDDLQKQVDAAVNSAGVTVVDSLGNMSTGGVYSQNVQAVVLITCELTTTSYFGQTTTGESSGSGFIISEDGYVVTNYHVVEGATAVTVSTYGGEEYPAMLVGYDKTNDVAVLKVEAQGLPYAKLGSSESLAVGDQVVAIGNPLGELTATLTVGYVSAKDRDVTTEGATINMIQTDAAINSGNSGGPLFNMKGEVVGITTAKYSGSSSSGATIEGIGFAIPIDDVATMIEDLINYGYVTGAYLGIGVNDVDSSAQYYGVPAGAYVMEVNEGSCAQAAGIQVGDIITGLGGYEVENYSDLKAALRKFKSGEATGITVYRSGQTLELTITLDEKPQETTAESTVPMPESGSYEEWYNYFAPNFGTGRGW